MRIDALVLSCEHGGNRVPAGYRRLFRAAGARDALTSHRGSDLGALAMAKILARRLDAELHASTVTRLLVETNRSAHHRGVFSEFSAVLDRDDRQAVLERHYFPHRQRIVDAIRARRRQLVCHIAVHSFAPVLNGEVRQADVGFLYDPRRPGERELCRLWKAALNARAPELRVRRNYPYRGTADGLTTALRRMFPPERYLGIELETNQAILTGPARGQRRAIDAVIESLADVVGRRPA